MTKPLTVDQSFKKFLKNLNPTEKQRQHIQTTRESIDSVIQNDERISLAFPNQPSFLTGSYSRNTIIRPIDDIDLYVTIHYAKHVKDKSPRSILLLMASALKKRYPKNTRVNVDSPCVVVKFWGYKFEVAPVVSYKDNPDLYSIPAPGSKSWMQVWPSTPSKWLSSCNYRNNKKFIPLIKMLKQWNRQNTVKLSSFHLELLTERVFGAVTEINSYPQAILDWFYCVKKWLCENDHPFVAEPGQSGKYIDSYLYENRFRIRVVRKKLDAGLKKAERAWDYYVKDRPIPAIRIWRSLFGDMFPAPASAKVPTRTAQNDSPPPPPLKELYPTQAPVGNTSALMMNALRRPPANPDLNTVGGMWSAVPRNTLSDMLANLRPQSTNSLLGDMAIRTIIDQIDTKKNPFGK